MNSGPGAHACAGQERWTPFVISDPVTGFLEVPPIFNNPKRLMNYMDQLMHREILACGVSPPSYACFRKFTVDGEGCQRCVEG